MAVFFIAFLGLLFGSFFNVLIWRIPRNESIVFPASHCPQCNRKIRPWENIPVISYLFLGGKCAGCRTKISIVYPVTELITAIAGLILWYTFIPHIVQPWNDNIVLGVEILFLILLLPIAVIDLQHYIIPDIFSLSLLCISFCVAFVPGNLSPLQSFFGILAGGGTLWIIGKLGELVFKKEDAMGGGDIKLMAAAGALWGPEVALLGIIFGALFGSLVGIPLILLNKTKSNHQIPFGPFLGLGIWVAVIKGNILLSAYVEFINKLFQ
jgi:leader peptidase (prepilin peptidase) / N-methyltransferase